MGTSLQEIRQTVEKVSPSGVKGRSQPAKFAA